MAYRLRGIFASELRSGDLAYYLQRQVGGLPPLHRNAVHVNRNNIRNNRRLMSSESFMKSVINQVKRDLEKDEKLQEAMKSLEEAHITQKVNKIGKVLSKSKDICSHYALKVSETGANSRAVKLAVTSAKSLVVGINKVAEMFHNEEKEAKKLKNKWKQRVLKERPQNPGESQSETDIAVKEAPVTEDVVCNDQEYALVLAKESAWERFGSKLRDMPFLTNFFENPVFDQIFGETSLASAIREMNKVDPSFNIPELMELVEHVVAPHIVQCYLDGNADVLKAHCGEGAFNVLSASIKERNLQKLSLDPQILILKDVELKGGVTMEDEYPWFIFNFTTQQINCLRDSRGRVVAGEIDDIREVVYSMALSKHPDLSSENLEYPYMVHEMAIIGNRPCW
ncbi:mitochondrial import inner membrane translocase subunit tim44 like protein [Babesia gibsoni]|uniref:Mitochondrial import inner membrane translocase subunit tim44 like protein n=1 Tax=Babesia gibsoni TaxID=33632 RepID=A0AAD8LJV3_BABGI|nr:mitochondrial import inner membrane translocase subunit tim44 like protein [Babesia gibsoni]